MEKKENQPTKSQPQNALPSVYPKRMKWVKKYGDGEGKDRRMETDSA